MTVAVIRVYHRRVTRWQPNARGRLEQAALELYGEHGFESTTVAEIAERAGLTERTFFRHFADKRELIKLASLASAIADAVRQRGVKDPAARLAAEAGIAVFKIAFESWTEDTGNRTLSEIIRESVDELKVVTGGRGPAD